MICKKCGAQLKEGCLYCSVCGAEVQIVPEYNILENDIIDSYIGDGKIVGNSRKETPVNSFSEKSGSDRASGLQKKPAVSSAKKRWSHKKRIVFCTIIVFFVAGLIFGISYGITLHEERNSFDYQYEMALGYYEAGNYEEALGYLRQALFLKENDTETMLLLADSLLQLDSSDNGAEAEELLCQVIELDPDDQAAYLRLLEYYENSGQYKKIESLSADITDPEIMELLEQYRVAAPVFSKNTGKYYDDLMITITDSDDGQIYYTTDGSDPIVNGKKYRNPISFSGEGSYVLKAVCRDSHDLYSEVVDARYQISYMIPDAPTPSLDSGTYEGEQWITFNVPADCTIYYTWDGSSPTRGSSQYAEPLAMPEGSSTLSVFCVSDKGKESRIVQYQYTRV